MRINCLLTVDERGPARYITVIKHAQLFSFNKRGMHGPDINAHSRLITRNDQGNGKATFLEI